MKKTAIILCLFMVILLTSCTSSDDEIIEILPEDLITMENLDDYMYRDDVQYVDLRNYNAKYSAGYIDGFEQIPFFDYLDYRAFDRGDTYEFNPDQLVNSAELERLFDKDKAIFLYADGCIRSGYIKDALFYLGYERVYVLGGFFEYVGQYKVVGIGDYKIGYTYYSSYESDTTDLTYIMAGDFDMGKKIMSIRFDIIDENGVSLRSTNYSSEIDYNEQLTILENYILSDIVTFNELFDELSNLETSKYNSISNYSLGYTEDFIALIETLNIEP